MDTFLLDPLNGSSPPQAVAAAADTNVSYPTSEEEVEGDYFDGVFKYIQNMLMEEEDELGNSSCMLQDCLALQAAEKIFDRILRCSDQEEEEDPSSFHCRSPTPALIGQYFDNPCDNFADIWNNHENITTWNHCQEMNSGEETSSNQRKNTRSCRDDDNEEEDQQRSSKQFAGYNEEIEETEVYDDALLCPDRNPNFYGESVANCCSDQKEGKTRIKKPNFEPLKPKRGRPRTGENKKSLIMEVVDLRDLLTRCAHSVGSYDNGTAQELLKKIRQHSSPNGGTATERLAHFFANALEARISGIGPTNLAIRTASASDILKAYESYITICPFQRMSNIFANKSIANLASSATRLHIIDFGILYGFQWPCIIHGISLRPGGPPMLKITGIDFPQPGFRPGDRIMETGRRLESFCKRFQVPFQFNAIAKKWDAIKLDELKIEKDEILVVNCLYRLRNVPDDEMVRDSVMDLIKKINPDLFVHGILNAGYNAPFFGTRFKEAIHHFSSMFDMFEANLPPEDQERSMFEREVLGRDIMNVIACEGYERIDRPDTYKQWQTRNKRAGFRQVPLNQKIMKEIKVKVRTYYHKEFLVDEDSNWMLQGWKGRVIYALSCWKPIH